MATASLSHKITLTLDPEEAIALRSLCGITESNDSAVSRALDAVYWALVRAQVPYLNDDVFGEITVTVVNDDSELERAMDKWTNG